MKEFRDRVAVVTGAASGIGRALAGAFAAEGMKVVLADVEDEPLERAAKELEADGATTLAVRTDVSKPEDVDALAKQTLDAFGAVHIVCNNAGVAVPGTLWETSLEGWRWTVDVNLWGVINGVRTFVPLMLEGGDEGHIVNTASAAGLASGIPFLSAYSVTKHAVVALSEALDGELSASGSKIKVSVLCPLLVKTRIMEADRNRPHAQDEQVSDRSRMFWDMLSQGVSATGTPPEVVAGVVLRAIREEKLYALPHPELRDQVRTRMDNILSVRSVSP